MCDGSRGDAVPGGSDRLKAAKVTFYSDSGSSRFGSSDFALIDQGSDDLSLLSGYGDIFYIQP